MFHKSVDSFAAKLWAQVPQAESREITIPGGFFLQILGLGEKKLRQFGKTDFTVPIYALISIYQKESPPLYT